MQPLSVLRLKEWGSGEVSKPKEAALRSFCRIDMPAEGGPDARGVTDDELRRFLPAAQEPPPLPGGKFINTLRAHQKVVLMQEE